ncbi:MAG: RsmB/NOP family class I SAM-dependent RNA methyltransferase, partial [Parachlamydiales bacterium]
MRHSFCDYHLLEILNGFEKSSLPLDAYLNQYLRANKAVGSKDRQKICSKLYTLIRFRGLIDAFLTPPIDWKKRLDRLPTLDLKEAALKNNLPSHVKVSFPKVFFQLLETEYGEKKALQIGQSLNENAPLTIRFNPLKTTRQELLEKLQKELNAPLQTTLLSEYGLTLEKISNLFALPAFKAGLFEMQDENSQLIALALKAEAGDLVLDFCAG